MIFNETPLKGAYVIELEPRVDERGFFCRSFCANEFKERGLLHKMVQSNISLSEKKHTLRGMHFQMNGHEEVKLVRCTKGKIIDTIIDLRPESETYCQHFSVELSPESNKSIYVPERFAHGFITLEDNSEVFYQVSAFYSPGNEGGIRWNDPHFNIPWPTNEPIISEKDGTHPDFEPELIS